MSPDRVTLIVCTYRRPEAVGRLLDALERQTHPPDEVLIVDASPNHDTAAVVADREGHGTERLRYVQVEERDRGLTRQRNVGIREATGTILFFLDDDTIPAPDYFAQIGACFTRHPEAIGVGGGIDGEPWRPATGADRTQGAWFRWEGWERRDDARWRLRRLLRLAGDRPPGYMPPSGHGRPVSFLPPSGDDYLVEFIMGGASAWRREVFDRHSFSPMFEGYGLYEDLDFCIDVAPEGPLYLCTSATLRHDSDPTARPASTRYGAMVVRNGWYVWRRRWPTPAPVDRLRWWLTTLLLGSVRLTGARGPQGGQAAAESYGRLKGVIATVRCEWSPSYRKRFFGPHSRLR